MTTQAKKKRANNPKPRSQDDGWLVGWQALCKHLGVSLRTAQRYVYEGKLPMYRGAGMTPRAQRSEVDAWIKDYSEAHPRRREDTRRMNAALVARGRHAA